MKRTIITTLILLFLWGVSNANSPEKKKEEMSKMESNTNISTTFNTSAPNNLIYPVWGFYFSGSGGAAGILLGKSESLAPTSSPGAGLSANIGFFRALSPKLKLMTGLGLDMTHGDLSIRSIEGGKEAIDKDGDAYFESFKIEELNDQISPMYISLPIVFEFGSTSVEKTGLCLDLGVRFSYLFSDSHSHSGKISTMGNYPQYNVTLGDYTKTPTLPEVPELGFVTNKPISDFAKITGSNDYLEMSELNNINISLQAGLGATFPLAGGQYLLKTGVVGYYGITDMSGDDLKGKERYMKNTFAAGPFAPKNWYLGLEISLYLNKEMK